MIFNIMQKISCILPQPFGITVESGYLAHAPNETTAAVYAPDNETRGLASSTPLTPPPIIRPFDFTSSYR